MNSLMFAAVETTINSDLNEIMGSFTGLFNSAKTAGITIITTAIGVGVIFVAGKWLWGKTKQWLHSL